LINAPTNLKHKTILTLIYSASLRISEAINLKVADIDSDNMRIWIRYGKGQKDRISILSPMMLDLLRIYYKNYKPKAKSKKNPKPAAIEELETAASKTFLGHQVVSAPSKPKKEPKTFIGKIWRWVNTE
jgi:site-specific recombinase XerD|tara:strand:+ start:650 stop:1036 length:387 start_codon:yes stop_codon:yes gene_type:complete